MSGRFKRSAGAKARPGALLATLLLAASLSPLFAPEQAEALVWPDVAEHIEQGLRSTDPAVRRTAVHDLQSLGRARATALTLTALADPDDDVKLAAADAVIRLHAAGATDVVVAWLSAGDPRLRREACEVARALPSPRAASPLARSLGDRDPELRAAAAAALGRQAPAEAVGPLLGRLDDPSPAVRIEIVRALGRLGDARAVVPLVGKVEDSAPDVRQAVVRALGDLGDRRASSALILTLRDSSAEVRRCALQALGQMRAEGAIDAIAPFARDREPALRAAAMTALGRIATPEAVRVLLGVLGTGDDTSGSLDATPAREAMVAAGATRTLPALQKLLDSSSSPQAATSAAWVIGALAARSGVPSVVASMRRGILPTAAALRAIGLAGGEDEVPVALEFIDDPSPIVRKEALAAALALLDPSQPDGRAVEPLAAALRDARPSEAERALLATLLGRTGATRAAPLLVNLTHAADASLRIAAVDALGTLGPIGSAAAEDALFGAMRSEDAAVRIHAAMALSRAGSARARDAIVARLSSGEELDRAVLLTALAGVLARAPSRAVITWIMSALTVAAGAERDALIGAVGAATIPSALGALAQIARSGEPDDRTACATMTAGHRGDAIAISTARTLLSDSDAEVRAQAAWALGTLGDASDVARLETFTRGPDRDVAVDSAAAIGRILARFGDAKTAEQALCPLLVEPFAYVRANALAGLALARARCVGGTEAQTLLASDPSEDVRAAAARALHAAPNPEDARALDRCASSESSSAVAALCRSRPLSPKETSSVLVYVVPDGSIAPAPRAPYAMVLADGMLRVGLSDRRGAVFDPVAPAGDVALRRPDALAP